MTSGVWVGVLGKNPFVIAVQKERVNERDESHPVSGVSRCTERDKNIGGLPVLRDLKGPICAHCGSLRYFLVFRVSGDGRKGILAGRCSRCRNPRELAAGEIERRSHA